MVLRLVLILALLQQTLLLPVLAGAPAGGRGGCARPGCCQLVERVTCCGKTVVEAACSRTGGPCACAGPNDDDAPPPAPAPRTTDTQTIVFLPHAAWTMPIPAGSSGARFGLRAFERPHASHNTTRARLGIWRT